MSLEDPKKTESTVSDNSKIRRKFLKRASAGTLIAAIPGRTAWAGLLNSIVASGHGSDFTDGECIQLYSPGYWKNYKKHSWGPIDVSTTFNDAFGGLPIGASGVDSTTTLLTVLQNPGRGKDIAGLSNVNFFLVCFYLNAANHGVDLGINFPVIGSGQPFANLSTYADYLYLEASNNPSGVGMLLSDMIDVYHTGEGYDPGTSTGNGASNLPLCN
tara:strand:- start:2269 stop:2913 length:645 start_codon:yes stop_codon:yes gene_type:complete